MNTTGWVVIGIVLCVAFVLAARQGNLRIENEATTKRQAIELELRKEENKRLEIMKEAISEARKAR
jgi:hypothetical protein